MWLFCSLGSHVTLTGASRMEYFYLTPGPYGRVGAYFLPNSFLCTHRYFFNLNPLFPSVPTFAVRETQSLGQQMLERWEQMGELNYIVFTIIHDWYGGKRNSVLLEIIFGKWKGNLILVNLIWIKIRYLRVWVYLPWWLINSLTHKLFEWRGDS